MNQAPILARYLLGADADRGSLDRFDEAARLRPIPMTDRDRTIVAFACRHPWSIGLLDGALAVSRPGAALRQKLFVMTAILEARPLYCDRFLPMDRSRLYVAAILFVCVRAAFKAIAGFVLLALIR